MRKFGLPSPPRKCLTLPPGAQAHPGAPQVTAQSANHTTFPGARKAPSTALMRRSVRCLLCGTCRRCPAAAGTRRPFATPGASAPQARKCPESLAGLADNVCSDKVFARAWQLIQEAAQWDLHLPARGRSFLTPFRQHSSHEERAVWRGFFVQCSIAHSLLNQHCQTAHVLNAICLLWTSPSCACSMADWRGQEVRLCHNGAALKAPDGALCARNHNDFTVEGQG